MVIKYIPNRGDIVWLDFEPQKGKEITKTRPALVLSPECYNNKTNLALFVPLTSQIKGYPFEIKVEVNKRKSAILCDQIRSLDWVARNVKKISTVDEEILNNVLYKLRLLLLI